MGDGPWGSVPRRGRMVGGCRPLGFRFASLAGSGKELYISPRIRMPSPPRGVPTRRAHRL